MPLSRDDIVTRSSPTFAPVPGIVLNTPPVDTAVVVVPVTTLPATPADGDLTILTDSTTAPTYAWQLQWSLTAAKWIFVGGSAYVAAVATAETSASLTAVDLATVGPSLTAPAAGVYIMSAAARTMNNTGTDDSYISAKFGGNAAVDICSIANVTASVHMGVSGWVRGAAVAKSDVIKMQYHVAGGGTGTWAQRTMAITPVYLT